MSYCRFSDGTYSPESDMYLYPDVAGYISCCCCRLADLVPTVFTKGGKDLPLFGDVEPCAKCKGKGCKECMIFGNTHLHSRTEAIKHVKEHIAKGHKIPKDVIKRLKQEIKKFGDNVD